MTLSAVVLALLLPAAPARVDSISATDLQGKAVNIQTAGKITAVLFISTQCPVSNAYNERMNALYAEYSKKGVQFVFLNANATEPAAEVAQHAKDVGFSFPVYKDNSNAEADRFAAEFTPHVFVIGKDSELIYKGGFDDARNVARVTKTYLKDALDAALSGNPVATSETRAFGCTIKRVKRST